MPVIFSYIFPFFFHSFISAHTFRRNNTFSVLMKEHGCEKKGWRQRKRNSIQWRHSLISKIHRAGINISRERTRYWPRAYKLHIEQILGAVLSYICALQVVSRRTVVIVLPSGCIETIENLMCAVRIFLTTNKKISIDPKCNMILKSTPLLLASSLLCLCLFETNKFTVLSVRLGFSIRVAKNR